MIGRFHAAPVHLQVLLMLAAAPVVVALFGFTLAPRAVEVALDGEQRHVIDAVVIAVRVAVAVAVACGCIAATGAAMLLRGSLRTIVDHLRYATDHIAAGEFGYRINSPRRDELGRLAAAIDGTAARLERLEQARRHVLACVSHELRTPLTIVRGHAFTLGRSETDADRRERFGLVEREAARLAAMLDDLVDTASLHAGGVRLDRERCDLAELALDAARRFDAAEADDAVRVEVHVRGRAHVDADVHRIDQVLGNLLGNAVRHAKPGSAVQVTVGHRERSHVVRVHNCGPEIPAGIADRIFEPFVQHGTQRGRIGLGLAIARDLAEAHGGGVTLVDRGERGRVTFELRLPCADGRGAPPGSPLERPRPARASLRRMGAARRAAGGFAAREDGALA